MAHRGFVFGLLRASLGKQGSPVNYESLTFKVLRFKQSLGDAEGFFPQISCTVTIDLIDL